MRENKNLKIRNCKDFNFFRISIFISVLFLFSVRSFGYNKIYREETPGKMFYINLRKVPDKFRGHTKRYFNLLERRIKRFILSSRFRGKDKKERKHIDVNFIISPEFLDGKIEVFEFKNRSIHIYLPADFPKWYSNLKLQNDLVKSVILYECDIDFLEKKKVPQWITLGIINNIKRHFRKDSIPGSSIFPGMHTLFCIEKVPDVNTVLDYPSGFEYRSVFQLYAEYSELLLKTCLITGGNIFKMKVPDYVKDYNSGNIKNSELFLQNFGKIFFMERKMLNSRGGKLKFDEINEILDRQERLGIAALNKKIMEIMENQVLNFYKPYSTEETEREFDKLLFFNYSIYNSAGKLIEKRKNVSIFDLPDNYKNISEAGTDEKSLQQKLAGKFHELSLKAPFFTRKSLNRISKMVKNCSADNKENYKEKLEIAMRSFKESLAKEKKIETYLENFEKKNFSTGNRYYYLSMPPLEKDNKNIRPKMDIYLDETEKKFNLK